MHQQSKGRDGRTCGGRRRKQLMILLVDNYDSFSYNLYQLIGEINPDIKVIRNDEMTVEEWAQNVEDAFAQVRADMEAAN